LKIFARWRWRFMTKVLISLDSLMTSRVGQARLSERRPTSSASVGGPAAATAALSHPTVAPLAHYRGGPTATATKS
jgi:hypothetical protein